MEKKFITADELIVYFPEFETYFGPKSTTDTPSDGDLLRARFDTFSEGLAGYVSFLDGMDMPQQKYAQALYTAHVGQLIFFRESGGAAFPTANPNVGQQSQSEFRMDAYLQRTKYGQLLAHLMRWDGIPGVMVLGDHAAITELDLIYNPRVFDRP